MVAEAVRIGNLGAPGLAFETWVPHAVGGSRGLQAPFTSEKDEWASAPLPLPATLPPLLPLAGHPKSAFKLTCGIAKARSPLHPCQEPQCPPRSNLHIPNIKIQAQFCSYFPSFKAQSSGPRNVRPQTSRRKGGTPTPPPKFAVFHKSLQVISTQNYDHFSPPENVYGNVRSGLPIIPLGSSMQSECKCD